MLTDEEQAVELTEAVLGQELPSGFGENTIVGIYYFVVADIGKVANDRLGQISVDDIYKAKVAFDTSPFKD